MAIKLTISVLFFIFFGASKCTDEFEFNFPSRVVWICDEGFQLLNENCYKPLASKENFDESQFDCQNISANLVSVHNAQTNQFLLGLGISGNILIGLRYDDTAFKYKWSDGSNYDFNNFPSDYVDNIMRPILGNCVMMQQNGEWVNTKCADNDKPHICQKPAHEKPTEEPPTDVPPNVCPTNHYYSDGGEISSPGYPYHYIGDSGGLNCSYILAASPAPLFLKFTELSDFGNGHSRILVYDGPNEQGLLLRNLTGDSYILPITITSTKPAIFVRFSSNDRGKWHAQWGPLVPQSTTTAPAKGTTTTTTVPDEVTTVTF